MGGSLYTHNERADSHPSTSACNMPKRKCIFTDELQKKFLTYSPVRDKWEAVCTVCKAGTYVSVSNGGASDLKAHMDTEKHKKAVQGESSSKKLTEFYVRPGKSEEA